MSAPQTAPNVEFPNAGKPVAQPVYLADPSSGVPLGSSVNPLNTSGSGGGGGGGAVTIADGADVTQGTSTDAANASTVIGQLKEVNTVQGAVSDASYTSGNGSVVSILKGVFTRLANIVTMAFDSTSKLQISLYGKQTVAGDTAVGVDSNNAVLTHQKLGGSDLSNSNPMPMQWIGQSGYIAASSPPTTTNVGADTTYTFSSQVNTVILQNNTAAVVNYAFDTAASAGSLSLAAGQTLIYSKKVTVVHLYTAAAQNINGTTAGNIVLLGEL